MQATPKVRSTALLPILSAQTVSQEKPLNPFSVLTRLQNMVYRIYRQHAHNRRATETDQIPEASQLVNDSSQIIVGLMDKLTGVTEVKDKNHYVQVFQVAMTRLLEKMDRLLRDFQLSKQEEELLGALKDNLQSAFFAFEELFGDYFDGNEMVPSAFAEATLPQLQAFNERRLTVLKTGEALNDDLASLLKQRIWHYTSSTQPAITYRALKGYLNFINEVDGNLDGLITTEVRRLVYKVNLFEEEWVNYEVSRLYALENGAETAKQKVALLRYEQKLINQWPACNIQLRDVSKQTLCEQVNRWIDEEVKFLEAGHSTVVGGHGASDAGDKIQTSLSVAKLAIIIRLLVIDKIIINRTVAPMLRIVARLFTTLQKDDISFSSLETKYDAPDKLAIASVRDMLFKWIKIIDKL